MRVLSSFLIILLCSFAAQGAFFNIDRQEKELMVACVFDLFLKKLAKSEEIEEGGEENSFDCAHIVNALTPSLYNKFISELRLSVDPNKDDPDWKDHLPDAYKTFNAFQTNVKIVCENGEASCRKIQAGTYHRSRFQRRTCNSLCSQRTCDPGTGLPALIMCYIMSENQIDGRDICPPDTVRNCLGERNMARLPAALARRGWPAEWVNLEESQGHLFLAIAAESAKGKSVWFRAVEIGGAGILVTGSAVAAVAAFPLIMGALVSAVPAAASFVKGKALNILQGQAMNGVNYAKDATQDKREKITKKVSDYANKDVSKAKNYWDDFRNGY